VSLPERFDRYRIDSTLGSGGMGAVFAAFDTKLKRRVALKILHHQSSVDALAQILREARAAAALDHPNTVQVFDVGEVDGKPFMSMEYVDGISLRSLIHAGKASRDERLRLLSDVAKALAHAHRAGLVHRDIKPENVMIRMDGVVKVLDFGIARRLNAPVEGGAGATLPLKGSEASSNFAGTPLYMAPEQARGEPLDPRCDQFAWGLVAFELFAGRLPWSSEGGAMAYLAALTSLPAPSLASIDPSIPSVVVDVVARALSTSRDDRFPTMNDLIASLGSPPGASERPASRESGRRPDPLAETEPVSGGDRLRTSDAQVLTPKSRGKRRSIVMAGGAAAVALVLAALFVSFGRMRSDDVATSQSSVFSAKRAPRVPLLDLPRPSTKSAEAMDAYLTGLRAERDWDIDDAVQSMRRALRADPDLAAASFRLGIYLIVQKPSEARDAFAVASRLRDRLSARDADVLESLRPWFGVPSKPGAAADALGLLESRYPGDAELLMLRGAGYFVTGRNAEAVQALRRSLDVDPAFAYASIHLAMSLAALGRLDEAIQVSVRCIQHSGTASSCWRTRLRLAHDKGNQSECGELALAAMAALPRSSRFAFSRLDAVAGSDQRYQVSPALEGWLELSDPATRRDDEARARAALDVLDGRFATALPALASVTGDDTFSGFGVEATWLFLLEETRQEKELGEAALRLRQQLERKLPPTLSPSSLLESKAPDVMRALLVSGAQTAADFERERDALEKAWLSAAPALAGIVWLRLRASFVDSPASATMALNALPAEGAPQHLFGGVSHSTIGKTYLLAGKVKEARSWLERAAGSCRALTAPVTWVRSQYWLGRALEADGDKRGACAAYATVVERWGKATPPSSTASDARNAARSLGCEAAGE
jgi:eukaryotic-like serine/threonine-protein kinase